MTRKRKILFRTISRRMGIHSRKKDLSIETQPEIHGMFQPHKKYPLYQILHEFAKLPKETVANFVSIPNLMGELRRTPAIGTLLKSRPQLEKSFERSVWQAIRERGIKSTKFWEKAPKSYIDAIVKAAAGRPNPMNERLGKIAQKHFGNEIRPRTILDIGTFAGGTIGAVVEKLPLQQRKMLTLVITDVNEKVMREYAVPKLVGLGVPRQNIIVLPTSFYSAAVTFKQMPRPFHEKGERRYNKNFYQLAGNVDLITAGASTINFANDLRPLFKSVRKLLKKGGLFVDWEWGSAEARERTVNIEKLKKTKIWEVEGKAVTEYDSYVSFLNFWLGFFNYPENVKQKLFKDIEGSKEFDFMGWCERNVPWMEAERIKAGLPKLPDPAGFRNRAYRTGDAMERAAKIHGFDVRELSYPFAKPGEKDTGNVNWMVVARKP